MNQPAVSSEPDNFDVVICGGGLAGSTLARQLKLTMPDISVALVDKLVRPLPEAAFKVGESITEIGAFYLARVLDLTEYFDREHITKLGFRFFFGDSQGPLEARPEFGLSKFPAVISTYQFDRGVLENDLRRFNSEAGVTMLEGWSIRDIQLAANGDPHQVVVRNDAGGEQRCLAAHWVVDAMGRRRYLQRKLGLTKNYEGQCSAAWFRFEGRVDVSDMVPPEKSEWHSRVAEDRYNSTNHLMGHGYWVWIIPLSSGCTSVGIVAQEKYHPSADFNSYELSMDWLRRHEPVLGSYLEGREPMDFKWMRKYSYTSSQLFSEERWSCVGEAGVFPDPFYAPGTDLIAFGNSITADMIRLERTDSLTPEIARHYNLFTLALNDLMTHNIQLGYEFFGNSVVMVSKVVWDTAAAWSILCPQMFNSIFLDPDKRESVREVTIGFFEMTQRMQKLFVEWGRLSSDALDFDFVEFLKIPMLRGLRQRNMHSGKSIEELVEDHTANMAELEELAQALFLLAIEDVLPEQRERLGEHPWLNYSAFSLQPEKWEADGLFKPRSLPRDLTPITESVHQFFRRGQAPLAH